MTSLSDFVASPRSACARPGSQAALWWPSKTLADVADYDVNWTWRLYSAEELAKAYAQQRAGRPVDIVPSDKIVSSAFLLPVGALEGPDGKPSTFIDVMTKVWLGGGDAGEIYAVVNRITTAGGRAMDQSVQIRVKTA
ncbi:hypothetical protein SAMN05216337_1001171 [Bradyrhizobium brasilense]|uniref:Uncharacterized protein n=1 Tax=Bradyrhizobium brasilense TaxID=1419277 RepID=A0A1G6IJG7_9BRAD|nr:hypothetical protein [Bradyrhizobium brasilense]SDC06732.1 hypothetical protein SAMN05216337_1001171 [Bradyrhizobium brasilense]